MSGEKGSGSKNRRDTYPFFPDHFLIEVIIAYIMLALLVILASLFPAGLEAKANPLSTPAHIKPEWYFLSLYQALKLVPRVVGILAPIVGSILLLLLPFLDRNPRRHPGRRPLAMGVTALILATIIALTIWGQVS
ncbi:MAG: cytochrome b subunit of the bc complex [Chloroflexi bacterium]|nr:cytochrome b subunit of the bc complex [Chloroflexota bacterium]MCL5075153.1 cytochrome b subunit of the bc complex [Chloroflexota bacterium]